MAYIGKSPSVGAYKVCDAITTSATDTFNLLVGGVATSPETANNCIVSLNGVVQKPGASGGFTISGSTIVFASALTTADVIDFIYILGDVMSIGTPSDSTVSLAKLTATGSASSSTFLRGDNSWQEAGGGKILQAQYATGTTTEQSTTSTSFVDVTNGSVAITCAATSSKVLLLATVPFYTPTGSNAMHLTILRDSTNLGDADYGLGKMYTDNYNRDTWTCNYVDSPSSTSAITYKLQFDAQGGTAYVCKQNNKLSFTVMEIGA